MKRECGVIVYNSFFDPLVQNLMLKYLLTLSEESQWTFHLITFEQPQYAVSSEREATLKDQLRAKGILWHPKNHRTGKLLLLKKLLDLLSISFLLLKLRLFGVKIIWSFANVAASIGWIYSRLFGFKTLIYSYEPHSEFLVELGIWERGSIQFRLLNYLENKAGIQGDYVLTGTQYMVDRLRPVKVKGKVFRAPTGVDEHEYYYRAESRAIINLRHGFSPSDKLLLYIGKFGDLYYTWQIPLLFRIVSDKIPDIKVIVISPTPRELLGQYFFEARFNLDKITYLTNVSYDDIKLYISAANLGISAVPPSPSQRFRSPTKVSEYLLCGLPYITCKGVSEDDIVALKYGVGVVLNDFSEADILHAIPEITSLLNKHRELMAELCRRAGLNYRSKSKVDSILKNIFDEILR